MHGLSVRVAQIPLLTIAACDCSAVQVSERAKGLQTPSTNLQPPVTATFIHAFQFKDGSQSLNVGISYLFIAMQT